MSRKQLFLCALGAALFAPAAQAVYLEKIDSVYGFSGSTYQNLTPHSDPTRVNYASANGSGFVEFASSPAPYVHIRVQSVDAGASLAAYLKYSFAIQGAADSFVPVNFSANYNVQNESNATTSLVRMEMRGWQPASTTASGTGADISCYGGACKTWKEVFGPGSSESLIDATLIGGSGPVSASWAIGVISGTFMVPTGALGQGFGNVEIFAKAHAFGHEDFIYPSLVRSSGLAWAFIDPKFEIDPAYLALNPSTALQIVAGVGNESALMPVPEPSSYLLMSVGALCLALRARRRRHAGGCPV